MGTRLELHELLCKKLGSRNVYFQPPESIRLKYPAIVYHLSKVNSMKADDTGYINHRRYEAKLITRDPDNTIIDDILKIPYCSFDRQYIADNLYHDCFDIYY